MNIGVAARENSSWELVNGQRKIATIQATQDLSSSLRSESQLDVKCDKELIGVQILVHNLNRYRLYKIEAEELQRNSQ